MQALWQIIGAGFTFAPTILLRGILEYVQSPQDIPTNVAWLFVVLLFVTAVIQATGQGQALHIGRRITIRLRAVIIGEIYTKALKRKVAAGTDTAFGEKKGQVKDGKGPEGEGDGGQANVGAIINLM